MEKFTLYSDVIEDYDQLKKDYLAWCEDNEIEPVENGEYEWFNEESRANADFLFHDLAKIGEQSEYFLAIGHSGTWQGQCEGGAVYKDLVALVKDLADKKDNFKVEFENGHLVTHGYHHDGTNVYEIYAISEDAYPMVEENYDFLVANRALNDTLKNGHTKDLKVE